MNLRAADVRPAQRTINGDPVALGIDRAVAELRRGRVIRIVDGDRHLLIAAVETLRPPLMQRMQSMARELLLLITPERAEALGIAGSPTGPVAIACPAGTGFDELRALAGVGTAEPGARASVRLSNWIGSSTLSAAAFQLAKAGRLVPAIVAFENGGLDDASVVDVAVGDLPRQSELVRHSLKRTSHSKVPLADAVDSETVLFRDEHGLGEHVAVLIGQPDAGTIVPVRLHSACLTGDLLGSLRCDCGEQLRTAVRRIAELGGGILLYLDQEGRGIGLANKLRAYAIQDTGLDTVDADRHLGFHPDERNYEVAAAILEQLGVSRICLLTNNPQKIAAMQQQGIDVLGRLPLVASTNSHNERYLKAKRDRAGHLGEAPSE